MQHAMGGNLAMLGRAAASIARAVGAQNRMYAAAATGNIALVKRLREETGAPIGEVKRALEAANYDLAAAHTELRRLGVASAEKKRSKRTASEGLISLARSPCHTRAALAEVNCETDFVAKNEAFQNLARQSAASVLATGATGQVAPEAIMGAPLGSVLEDVSLAVREKIEVRRCHVVTSSRGGVIGTYLHMSRAPDVGSIGALVCLEPVDAAASVTSEDARATLADLGHKLAMHVVAAKPLFLRAEDIPADFAAREEALLRAQPDVASKPAEIVDRIIQGRLAKHFKQVVLTQQPFVMDDAKTVDKVLSDAAEAVGCAIQVSEFLRLQVGEGVERKEETGFAEEVARMANQTP